MSDIWSNPRAFAPMFTEPGTLARQPVMMCVMDLGYDDPMSELADQSERGRYAVQITRFGRGAPACIPAVGMQVEVLREGQKPLALKITKVNTAITDYWSVEAREC